MDINSISNIIATVGFPIVACGGLFWMINTTMKDLKKSIDKNTEATITLATSVKSFHDNDSGGGVV